MNHFLAAALSTLALTACQPDTDRQKPKAKAVHVTKIASTVQLPNDDGHVYVIESPADDFGFEVNACMLHVKGGASSMSCTPPKVKLPAGPE